MDGETTKVAVKLLLTPDEVAAAHRNPDRVVIRPLAVTVEQAARMLNIGRATMYKVVMRGEVVSFTVGRSRRIPVEALNAYVSRQVGA